MFYSYNYFRQHNNNEPIEDYKAFYKHFSNTREFGGNYTHMDHLIRTRFQSLINHMFNVVLRKQPENILDIGCGNGINLPFANIFPNIKYCAIDYAEKTVEAARKNYPNIEFKVGDAFALPYEDESFDMAIMSSVLVLYKNEEDRVKLLKEAARVLKKDGVLVLNVWNDTWMIRNSLRLSRIIGKMKKDRLPLDFLACHFNKKDMKSMVAQTEFSIEQRIKTAQLHGVLECAQYINRHKYHRNFGHENLYGRTYPQNIKEDLYQASNGNKIVVAVLYALQKIVPNQFSWINLYILKK